MTTTMTATWWRAFLTGDLNAFAKLVEHHQADVFAVALAMVLDRALAEDVAQETFIAAFERRVQLRDPAAFGGWLAQIARNLGRDLLRKRKREQLVDALEVAAEVPAETPAETTVEGALAADARDIEAVVRHVPPRYREVLVLYYAHDRSVASIAASLGLSEAATMQRLSRARRMIKARADALKTLATARPRRSFTVAVLALLALRRTAQAAPPRPRRSGWFVAGLAAMVGVAQSDQAEAVREPAVVTAPPAPLAVRPVAAPRVANVVAAVAPVVRERVRIARPSRSPRVEPVRTAAHAEPRTAALDEPARCETSLPLPPPPPLAVAEAACPSGCKPERTATLPFDQITGFLETAALPRAGDISYDTIGLAMVVRAGVTEHVALHVGMTGIDTDRGTPAASSNPAFGGGIKIGARVAKHGAVAVLAEGAREVNLKTMETKEGYLARAYAAATLGTARDNVTVIGGVVAEFDGTNRWRSPLVGVSTNVGWDDHLGFVLESQRFTEPRDTLTGTSIVAVRFRAHGAAPVLGIERVRIDVGMLMLHRADDEIDLLPWLQAGLGW